jgi:hypothetical protein
MMLTCVMASVPWLCQEVNLGGTVSSLAGGVVANASVALLGSSLVTLTNAQGVYQLTGDQIQSVFKELLCTSQIAARKR